MILNRRNFMCSATAMLAIKKSSANQIFSTNRDVNFRDILSAGGALGVFIKLSINSENGLSWLNKSDPGSIVGDLLNIGAKYVIIVLGVNSGFYVAENYVYEKYAGYRYGERCGNGLFVRGLVDALNNVGIACVFYLPAQAPNRDPVAQVGFGMPAGVRDNKIENEFAYRWGDVISYWSEAWGKKISGWWFDGCYKKIGFNEEIGVIYKNAALKGNPYSLVAFNGGVGVGRSFVCENYSAGEFNNFSDIVYNTESFANYYWHFLTFLGKSWGTDGIRFSDNDMREILNFTICRGLTLTIDLHVDLSGKYHDYPKISEGQLMFLKNFQKIWTA